MIEENQEEQEIKIGGTPYWDSLGEKQLPFFNPTEVKKKEGLRVKFLSDGPRKQTVNRFDPKNPKAELWFDIEVMGNQMTWTISQVSLLVELKNHSPLKDNTFDIKLVPVDENFKKQNPKYKGSTRYKVTPVAENLQTEHKDNIRPQPDEELIK